MNKQIVFSGGQYYHHAAFWKKKLHDETTAFILETDSLQEEARSGLKEYSFSIGREQQQLLAKYAGNKPLETFLLLLTGYGILFSEYMQASHIILNTPLFGKNIDDVWERNVPLVIDVNKSESIKQLLHDVNTHVLESYRYQNFPFDRLHIDNELVTTNMLSNVLIWHDDLHETPGNEELLKHDLNIQVRQPDEMAPLSISIKYAPSRFRDDHIAGMSGHINQVILAFAELGQAIENINLLSAGEMDWLKNGGDHTAVSLPANGTVLSVFREQVRKTPDGAALIFGERLYTYAELDDKSTRVACYLKKQYGVQKGDFVGVLTTKSDISIISLLAVMKAGAVYVPIDPQNPPERTYYVIADAHINTLLTNAEHLFSFDRFPGNLFAPDIQLDDMEPGELTAEPLPDDTAYLIYTSGSTGKPKGVLISHQGLLNVSLHHVAALQMKETDKYLQFMSLSFDGSLLDIFTTLLSGAALVVPDKEVIRNAESFLRFVDQHQVSIFTVTPSYLAALNKARMDSVHTIISAGEAANVEDALYYAGFKNFYNGYGPSEVAVNATLFKVDAAGKYRSVPIGRPGWNKKIYITGRDMQLRPRCLAGEIWVSGTGLAKGYLNDEALTSDKFIPDPFAGEGMIYRTGDLGRWLPDGNIEFLGRIDEQVKINGFRIDVTEIAQQLEKYPQVRNVKVLVDESANGRSLVAFFHKDEPMELVPSLGEYAIYDSFIYQAMATDEMRVSGYKAALKDYVKGKVVLDPGTGSEMILARHCAEAGAKKVYAIEVDDAAYETAVKNLKKYHLEDKISLIKGKVEEVALPDGIDCVVSALAGNISSSDGCIPLVRQLKSRIGYPVDFLPGEYLTRLAAITLPEAHFRNGVSKVSAYYIGQVFDKYGYPFDLRLCLKHFDVDCILSEDKVCEHIVYGDDIPEEASVRITMRVLKAGTLTGFACWINAFFGEQLIIDSKEATHHLPVYFPVFEEGVAVTENDTVEVCFTRKLSDNGLNPDYFIEGKINKGQASIDFSYSSFNHRRSFRANGLYRQLFDASGNVQTMAGLSENELKEYLAAFLPQYMIPSRLLEVKHYPVTANGKIDKEALLSSVSSREPEGIPVEDAVTGMEKVLAQVWKNVLGKKQVSAADDFFMSGGDSIKAIQIVSRLLGAGYKLEVKHIFEYPVLRDLATVIVPVSRIADQGAVTGEIPLTPIQQEVFLNDQIDPHHFNQAVMLYSPVGFDVTATREVFRKVQEHHDALRIVFLKEGDVWTQVNKGPDHPLSLSVYELGDVADADAFIEEEANRIQSGIDLEHGPLMKIGLFRSDRGDRLLIVVHHLVIDGISWRIIIEDVERLFGQYRNGEELSLPVKTDSFKMWAEKLQAYANSEAFLKERTYWKKIGAQHICPIEKDYEGKDNFLFDAARASFTLSEEETAILLTRAGSGINDALLTALSLAVRKYSGHNDLLVAMEGHGREDLLENMNISRTVGWFTVMYPLQLRLVPGEAGMAAQIDSIHKCISEVPAKGIGYGLLKWLTREEHKKELSFDIHPQICFNYLGQFDADIENTSYSMAEGSTGNTMSVNKQRPFELDVNGMVLHKHLQMTIVYNKKHFRKENMQQLCNDYREMLAAIVAHYAVAAEKEPVAGGFTYKELSVDDLDEIFK